MQDKYSTLNFISKCPYVVFGALSVLSVVKKGVSYFFEYFNTSSITGVFIKCVQGTLFRLFGIAVREGNDK